MELVNPSIKYKKSFLEALDEYQREEKSDKHFRGEHYDSLKKEELEYNFQAYVDKVISKAKGQNLPEGYVPESTYWLVDNNEFIGRVNLRHKLNVNLSRLGGHIGYDIRPSKRGKGYGRKILGLALQKAQQIGLDNVLITCNINNIPSKRVIEANGGILENSEKVGDRQPDKLRYWITIDNLK